MATEPASRTVEPIRCSACGGEWWEQYAVTRLTQLPTQRAQAAPAGPSHYRVRCADCGAPEPAKEAGQ